LISAITVDTDDGFRQRAEPPAINGEPVDDVQVVS
jgi:hypothetical protein